MSCDSVVRKAGPADYQEVWRLLLQGHRENGIFQLANDKVDFFIVRALCPERIHPDDTGPRGQIAVIGSSGKLEAICFLVLASFWYTHEIHLEELIVYVDPECRRSGHARALIEWMKKTADALQAPVLSGIMSRERTEAKTRMYDRLMPRIGALYLYPLKDDLKRNNRMEKTSWLAANGVTAQSSAAAA